MDATLRYALMHAIAVVLYVAALVCLIFYGESIVSSNIPELVAPILVLLLLVVSAAVMGMLVFLRPLMWYLDGKKKEAIHLAIYTVAGIALIAALICVSLIALGPNIPAQEVFLIENNMTLVQ